MLYSYQSVANAPLAPISVDPETAVTSSSRKSVLGFPAGLYNGWSDYRRERLHETGPFTLRLYRELGDYFGRNSVSTGPGASGGGMFVEEAGEWRLAALLISGLEKSLGDSRNAMGVVLLSATKQALIDEAIEESHTHDPPEILSSPEEVVADWDAPTEITVEYDSPTPAEIIWHYKDPSGDYFPDRFDSAWFTNDGTSTTLTIPAHSLFLQGKLLQVSIETAWKATFSELIPFAYRAETPLAITQSPLSTEALDNGPARFEVVAEGFPDPPTYQWEIDRERDGTFEELWDNDLVDGSETAQLTLLPHFGRYSGIPVRVRVSNTLETVVSDPAMAIWADAGVLSLEVVAALPDRLGPGETVALELRLRGTGKLDNGFGGANWFVQRRSGSAYTVTSGSTGPYRTEGSSGDDRLKIWISNHGDSVNGDHLRFTAKGGGYVEGVWKDFEQTLEFTVSSAGEPPLIESFDLKSASTTVSLDLVTGGPTEIEWQVSFDEGASWVPLSADTMTSSGNIQFPIGLAHYQRSGAWIRTKISDDEFTVRSEPLQLTKEAALSMDGVRYLDGSVDARGGLLATTHDRFAYFTSSSIDVYERVSGGWTQKAAIPIPEGEELYLGRFHDSETLVVTRPDYAGSEGTATGGLSVYIRQPDGSWPECAFVPATISSSLGSFGLNLAGSESWLAVRESPTGGDQPDRVQLYQWTGNTFALADTITVDFLPENPRVAGMDLEGNRLLLRFAGYGVVKLYEGDPSSGEWSETSLPDFLVTAATGTFLKQDIWWQLRSRRLEAWTAQGSYARGELDATFQNHRFFPGDAPWASALAYQTHTNDPYFLTFEADFTNGRVRFLPWKLPDDATFQAAAVESDFIAMRVPQGGLLPDLVRVYSIRDLLPVTPGPDERWWYEASSTLEAGQPILTMRVRLPAGVNPAARLEVSQNLDTWVAFADTATSATLVEADADGDGLTALWELRLPALIEGRPAYYRFADE